MEKPLVSVIIPTLNSSKILDFCLIAVKEQVYPSLEVIVVDNYSTDNTREIAKSSGAKILQKGSERSMQRNHGARNAKGKYLLFLDSDIGITSKVIDECVREAEGNKADAVVIPEVFVGDSFWAKCRALEKSSYLSREVDHKIEAARFFLTDVFWKMNGYDETIIGIEDWDLSQRVKEAGFKISKISSPMIHNEGKLTLIRSVWKAFYYAKNSSSYFDRARYSTVKHVVLSRFAWFRRWRLLMRDPAHLAGMLVMKSCEFFAAFFGYVASKSGL